MNKEYKRYIGITTLDDRFYKSLDEESMTWASGANKFPLDFDLSSLAESQNIEYLQIFCQRVHIDYVPRYIRELRRLKHLHIPSTVAENLASYDLPEGLESMYIYGNHFSFKENLHLGNLVSLGTSGLEVGFRSDNFLKLQSFSATGDKVRTLKELSKLPSLSEVGLLKPR